jgi:transposase-like protein
VAILREHLLEGAAVSDVCEAHSLNPTVFYRWQKEFFEHGTAAFDRPRANASKAEERRVQALEDKLQKKDNVIAEIMAELIAQKKRNGEI